MVMYLTYMVNSDFVKRLKVELKCFYSISKLYVLTTVIVAAYASVTLCECCIYRREIEKMLHFRITVSYSLLSDSPRLVYWLQNVLVI